jgi:acyl-coenzyme A thioesterase PaaI-like protein
VNPPGHLIALIAAAKRAGEVSQLVEAVPYARFMGISALVVEGELLGHLQFAGHLIGNPMLPALHGGVLGALLESTAIFQLMWETEAILLPKTITLTVDYLRSGRAVDTFARGILTRQGRRVASVRVEAWQDDRSRPIAVASAHFLIETAKMPEPPEPGQDG